MRQGKTYLRKNDQVEVIAGKDKGRVGKVLRVFRDENKVIVERINLIKRHTKGREMNQPGQIVEKEAPVHISNVQLICPECTQSGRISHKILDDGVKIRMCKNCGESIDKSK